MKITVYAFLILLAASVQAVLPGWSAMGAAKAPFLLAVVLYAALTRGRVFTFSVALAAGLVQDALGLIPLGFSAIAFGVAAVPINAYRREMYIGSALTHAICGALASLAMVGVLAFGLTASHRLVFTPGWLLWRTAGTVLLGALVTPVVCSAAHHLEQRVGTLVLGEGAWQ